MAARRAPRNRTIPHRPAQSRRRTSAKRHLAPHAKLHPPPARTGKSPTSEDPKTQPLTSMQPIRWSHWLLSYGAFFADDLLRLREVIKRVNRCPLGCGAVAGNAFDIDREAMAEELGFEGLLPNSMAAVADRVFVLETMQWGATLMMNISRWSEDLIIYSSSEFGFVRLADAYTTGSSLMPQKKNGEPDPSSPPTPLPLFLSPLARQSDPSADAPQPTRLSSCAAKRAAPSGRWPA